MRRTIAVFGAALLIICAALAYLVQPWSGGDPLKAEPPAVSPQRLEAHVRMLADDFVPRDFANPANLDRAAAYIRQEFVRAGGTVAEQPFDAGRSTYRNVIAEFGPDTRERIVIGAHYDAAGPYPAADDNASGVAGLLELAQLLGKNPPSIRVELVAYPLEEPPFYRTPLMGSAVHAASLKRQGARVRVMMSLEMIGYFTDAPNSQQLPLAALRPFYPSRGNFIAVVGKMGQALMVRRIKRAMKGASPLGVHSINAPRWVPGVDFSDHMNYWDAGYPAVMITDTAFYRNPNYHTARDTADTLDYDRMAQVVQGVHAAILALS